jgi:tripartite-type tricarboxylate transporter receptor subunit TctC
MLTRLQGMDADGTTLGVGVSIPVWINLHRRGDQLPFDLDSFDWLATMGRAGLALVAATDSPAQDFDSLLEQARAGGVTVATNGPAQEMIVSAIASGTGAELVSVPTQSSSEAIQNVLGGHVDAATLGGAHVDYVRNGQMKVLAGLAPVRDTADESVPTLMEMGHPYAVDATFYIAAPAGLSQEAKAALTDAIDEALASDAAVTMLNSMSMSAKNLGPEGTTVLMDDGMASVGEMLKALGN